LSEIILQQTRIQQGYAYWERFMQRFPTVNDLAEATEDEVLRYWQGLGYYSRARNLHTAAQQIVTLGHFPNTFEDIKKLKGVGDYTAAAVGSIAFNLPVAVVDGNVYRVLSRVYGIETPINSTEGKARSKSMKVG
jgi:A/G-specific adenine glycosylase